MKAKPSARLLAQLQSIAGQDMIYRRGSLIKTINLVKISLEYGLAPCRSNSCLRRALFGESKDLALRAWWAYHSHDGDQTFPGWLKLQALRLSIRQSKVTHCL